MIPPVADWQLPPGVNRPLWDYLHNADLARDYDAGLLNSFLFTADLDVARRLFVRPGRLIDLGCGSGRLLLDFARRGFSVVGVDLSEPMLRVAAEKAAEAGVQVQLLKANLVELDALADGTFDYAACLFSTLGMIDGVDARARFLAQVRRLLRPGGTFLLHVHNRWFHCWNKAGRRWLLADLGRTLLGRANAGDWSMPAHQGVVGLTLHHFTRREAIRLLRGAGFGIMAVHPLSLRPDGRLSWPAWFAWLRAYGYLIAARSPTRRPEGGR
jgi:SAM-dependent methyltransferase